MNVIRSKKAILDLDTEVVIGLVLVVIAIVFVAGIMVSLMSGLWEKRNASYEGFMFIGTSIYAMENDRTKPTDHVTQMTVPITVDKSYVIIGFPKKPATSRVRSTTEFVEYKVTCKINKIKPTDFKLQMDPIKCPDGKACLCLCGLDGTTINCAGASSCMTFAEEVDFRHEGGCDIAAIAGNDISNYCLKEDNGYAFVPGVCSN